MIKIKITQDFIDNSLTEFRKKELCELVIQKAALENRLYREATLKLTPEQVLLASFETVVREDIEMGIQEQIERLQEDPDRLEELLGKNEMITKIIESLHGTYEFTVAQSTTLEALKTI